MRTTIEVSDEIMCQAKKKAADEGTPLRHVVQQALRLYLGKPSPRRGYRLRWRAERGRFLPGARRDDRESLFDLMDGGP
jgi:hypothetical protein